MTPISNNPKDTKCISLEEFFDGYPSSRTLFDHLYRLTLTLDPVALRITKSQIALIHARPFAWIWIPEKYLHRKEAPLVLSISFPERDPSPHWKEIVEPAKAHFMHHLEIYTADNIDSEVEAWLRKAWTSAGNLR